MNKPLLVLIIFILSIIPVNAAVIYGGKLFSGDSFTTNTGVDFTIYGSSPYNIYNNDTEMDETYYAKVLIRSAVDGIIEIRNSTCVSTQRYVYCYKSSLIDYSDARTYSRGDVSPLMSITIENLPPPTFVFTLDRIKNIDMFCGELVEIPIIVTNNATFNSNFTYTETLPENMFISTTNFGVVDGNKITFKDHITSRSYRNYTYTVVNLDCASKYWNGTYTFTTFNDSVTMPVTDLSLTVKSYYNVSDLLSTNKTNYPGTIVTYGLNITTFHPSIIPVVNLRVELPKDFVVSELSQGFNSYNEGYIYTGVVPSNSEPYLRFSSKNYGTYTIKTSGVMKVNDHEQYFSLNKTLQILPSNVTARIELNTSGNTLYVTVIVYNDDMVEKYYYIYGIIKGISDEEPVYANFIDPNSKIELETKSYNLSKLISNNSVVVFDGIYRDKNSIEHNLYASAYFILVNNSIFVNSTVIDTSIDAPKLADVPVTSDTPKVVDATNPNTNTASQTTPTPNDGSKKDAGKTDILTSILTSLNAFFKSIFG